MSSASRQAIRSRAPISATKPKKQLRGRQLNERVILVVEELVGRARHEGRIYVYNASEVARLVPTTRKSLGKYSKAIGCLLERLNLNRRTVSGKATMRELRNQATFLRNELERRDKIIKQLRSSHVSIYDCFLAATFDGHQLLRAIEAQANDATLDEAGKCCLCGSVTKGRVMSDLDEFQGNPHFYGRGGPL